MNSRILCNRFIAFSSIGLLFLSGCSPQAIKVGVTLFTTLVVSEKQIEAANLDVEAKKLEIEAIKKNGEKVFIVQTLDDQQIQELKEAGKAEITLEDGSTATITVTVGASQTATSLELEKVKSYIDDNNFVDFKKEDGQFSGKIFRSWMQETAKAEDSGAAAKIEWNDGAFSSILFLENYRTRVWIEGVEYGGKWSWEASETLQVRMDGGSVYSFGSVPYSPQSTAPTPTAGSNVVSQPTDRPILGVQIVSLTEELRHQINQDKSIPHSIDVDKGVLVAEVSKDYPAAKAGIQAGDVIVKVNAKTVVDVDEFINEMKNVQTSTALPLEIYRGQQTMEILVYID